MQKNDNEKNPGPQPFASVSQPQHGTTTDYSCVYEGSRCACISRLHNSIPSDMSNPTLSVYTALWINGQMLGLTCGTSFPAKSRPVQPDIPVSLHPTLLQLTTVHWLWIDRIPVPESRDEFILNMGMMEEDDFLQDIFCMESFTLMPGCSSWDPSGWRIRPAFQQKWGHLFPSLTQDSGCQDI